MSRPRKNALRLPGGAGAGRWCREGAGAQGTVNVADGDAGPGVDPLNAVTVIEYVPRGRPETGPTVVEGPTSNGLPWRGLPPSVTAS